MRRWQSEDLCWLLSTKDASRTRKALREDAGTIPSMALEWYQGRRAGARVDVWSLGVLLYETATGRRPFRDGGPGPALSID